MRLASSRLSLIQFRTVRSLTPTLRATSLTVRNGSFISTRFASPLLVAFVGIGFTKRTVVCQTGARPCQQPNECLQERLAWLRRLLLFFRSHARPSGSNALQRRSPGRWLKPLGHTQGVIFRLTASAEEYGQPLRPLEVARPHSGVAKSTLVTADPAHVSNKIGQQRILRPNIRRKILVK